MKVLVCGAGKIARELLKRLGETWQVSVIEKSGEVLTALTNIYPDIAQVWAGDASSPVVLDEADVEGHDYVLALTNNDPVNLAVCRHAHAKGVDHLFARVHDPQLQADFQALGVKTVMVNTMIARTIYHYLQDPRLIVTPMGQGRGEILEIDVTPQMGITGKKVITLGGARWRPVAVMRQADLLFPDLRTEVQDGDRLIIVGNFESFEAICNVFNVKDLDFPLNYGRGLLLALPPKKDLDEERLMAESFQLAQNTSLRQITVLGAAGKGDPQQRFGNLVQGIDIRFETTGDNFIGQIKSVCAEHNIGMAVIPPFDPSFIKSLTKSEIIDLAHALPCPLFVARNCWPFERILVPFNATFRAEQALEIAINLSHQVNGRLTAVIVQEPEFIHGANDESWVQQATRKIRHLAHVHKVKIEEICKQGNPVTEIAELSKDFDLLVLGSTTKEGSLFSPHVGELLARKAACSVMVIAS